MRAAVIAKGGAFEIAALPDPTPAAGEVVVRVRASGVCGSDLKARPYMSAGTIMGHEFAGDVVSVGAGVDLSIGTLVAALPVTSCGDCGWCRSGNVAHCKMVEYLGINRPGGFAEYAVLPAEHALALEPGMSASLGALVEPFAVGLHGVVAAGTHPGDEVLVVGGGTVGLTFAAWARDRGAARLTVVDPAPARRDLAIRLGATDVIEAASEADAASYDVVAECVGRPDLLDECAAAARTLGKVIVLGVCGEPDSFLRVTAVLNELTLHFSVGYLRSEFTATIDAFVSGRINPNPLLGTMFALEEISDAFDSAASTPAGKVFIEP